MEDIQTIKKQFGIIGNTPALNHAIEIACQVAKVDITVLIQGESGVGKEFFPNIIHKLSPRKQHPYIAVNCGAIPEGTIDSELFGHEKGSFTGATESRKGYFETADGGTIFLDEVAELPLTTQVRLLRVLETGEFIKVGSSKVQKTNVRVVAATNDNMHQSIQKGKFRMDLYYRLNTVPIFIPPLRERKDDIPLLFRRFAMGCSEAYNMPQIELTPEASVMLKNYRWDGNVRQLKNVTEQISIIEKDRLITPEILRKYLPDSNNSMLPVLMSESSSKEETISMTERDILYKILFDMKAEVNELHATLNQIIKSQNLSDSTVKPLTDAIDNIHPQSEYIYDRIIEQDNKVEQAPYRIETVENKPTITHKLEATSAEIDEEPMTLEENEKILIKRALSRHKNKRKAADELGISERTLYRKIKEYDLENVR